MKIVREKASQRVIYAFQDGEPCEITDSGMETPNTRALDIRQTTHEIIDGVPEPQIYVGGALTYDGAWSVLDQDAISAKLAEIAAETAARYEKALDAHIDDVAKADRWDSRITACMAAGFPNPWQERAKAFAAWAYSQCYPLWYRIMAEVQAGSRPLPTIEEFIALMPVMEWPE